MWIVVFTLIYHYIYIYYIHMHIYATVTVLIVTGFYILTCLFKKNYANVILLISFNLSYLWFYWNWSIDQNVYGNYFIDLYEKLYYHFHSFVGELVYLIF